MPKFYVNAGDFKTILNSNNHENAVINAFKKLEYNPVQYLNSITQVSEKGFHSKCDKDMWFLTNSILELTGLNEIYKDANN